MSEIAKRKITNTVIFCVITLIITMQKHAGFILGMLLIFLIPVLLQNFYFIYSKKSERKYRSIQAFLWIATCLVVIGHHVYLHKTTRTFAAEVSSAVVMHQQQHAFYPNTLEQLGFDRTELRKRSLMYSYEKNAKPILIYRATWIPFEAYHFDFDTYMWSDKPR